MLVQDVMTKEPLTVTPDTRVKQAVTLLAERRISALPVVDSLGHVFGIVSEADLIRGAFAHDARAHEMLRDDTGRRPALLVSEVMTSPAVTVRERTDLAEVVELMTSRSLKSLPVVDAQGRAVGMLSRSDVLRVRARPDDAVAQDVRELMSDLEHPDWLVEVHDGVVTIEGPDNQLDRSIATVAANTVAGVVEVSVQDR